MIVINKTSNKSNKFKTAIVSVVLLGFLSGCTSTQPIKAPCNASGSNCEPRIKINQWDNN